MGISAVPATTFDSEMTDNTLDLCRPLRSTCHRDYPLAKILAAKESTTVSVCLPARNEAATIGVIVSSIRKHLLSTGAIDELVVIDDQSSDDTAQIARAAGARVENTARILPEHGVSHGKGSALWKSLYVTDGDVVIWCDSDITDFGPRLVQGILGALLCEDDVDLAKGFYRRPEREREGGGRVTELVARPLLSLFHPQLALLAQPLSGEYGGRRDVLESLPFTGGYGVEVGLLIDYVTRFGADGLIQVDLDVRHHRNRTLADLGPQAMAITQAVLRRAAPGLVSDVAVLMNPDTSPVVVEANEHPPMRSVGSYRSD